MTETRKVQIGIIGAGRIARLHTANLAHHIPEAKIVAVADVVVEMAQKLGADFQIPGIYADPRKILQDKTIDAVLICSSSDTHAQLMEEAAAAKKHIFCEKPIALDLAKIDHALAAVRQAGVKLQVGFNRRFDPSFKRVREIVAGGDIGTPHILRITSRDPEPPPMAYVLVSGGIFLDMTIHDFDTARFLVGSEVEEIYAAGGVLVDPAIGAAGDMDTAVITLRFANGALGVIDNSRRASYGYDQRVEVLGSKGMVQAGNKTPDTVMQSDGAAVHSSKPVFFFLERYGDAFAAEMREFVLAVAQDKPTPVGGIDGRMAVLMGYAALKSAKENRPVRLAEVDRK